MVMSKLYLRFWLPLLVQLLLTFLSIHIIFFELELSQETICFVMLEKIRQKITFYFPRQHLDLIEAIFTTINFPVIIKLDKYLS